MSVPVTVAFLAAVWAGAVALGLDDATAIAFGVAATALIVGLLVLLHHERSARRGLAVDGLTGLDNHRSFHERLGAALASARLEGVPTAVVMLDLDDFKAVNEAHGHAYGDAILRAVAVRLRAAVRAGDIVARVGGEEFALALYNAGGEQGLTIAERARTSVGSLAIDRLKLTATAGVATFPDDSDDPAVLFHLAGTALQWAKEGGGNRARRFDAGHTPGARPERHREEIERLLATEEPIRPVFQPIVSLATGRLLGYEALARFPALARGSPEAWFAQAHGCGLGPELEAAAIRAAIDAARRPIATFLSLNVSPSALASDVVQRALPEDLSGIVIEITEHEFVPDDDDLAATIAALRRRGARIALDDAGSGHAGLTQLMRMRPDIVKLDRELTEGIHSDPARVALVESFVRFAHYIDGAICAEGIETHEDLTALANLDVQLGQGYVLARPAPPWARVAEPAAATCRAALDDALRATGGPSALAADHRLVELSARLAGARSREEVEQALGMIAAESGSHRIVLSRWSSTSGVIETVAANGRPRAGTAFPISEYPLTAFTLDRRQAMQVFVGDPEADPAETRLLLDVGERSLLMVPVVSRGTSIGLLEVYGSHDRPWTRAEINRVRVIANQCAPLLAAPPATPAGH